VKVWKEGTAEPADWQLTATDNTASLQVPGGVGLLTYLSGSSTSAPETASFQSFSAGSPVPASAQPPVADFTASSTDLTASFDASASNAPAGTIVSYGWEFGDGTTGSGVAPSHVYATSGTYPVTLTVTDSLGGTASSSQSVTVGDQTLIAADTFSRDVLSGWGTSDVGGSWTDASGFSVGSGAGSASLAATATSNIYLGSVNQQDVDATIQFGLDRLPAAGSVHANLLLRSTSAGDYRAKVVVSSTGSVTVYLAKYVGTTETVLAAKTLSGYTYTAGAYLDVRFQVTTSGASTALKVMVWPDDTTAPSDWLLTATDSQAELQGPGRIGLSLYVSKSVPNGPIVYSVDNLHAVKP
jgi:PKD repeat protein